MKYFFLLPILFLLSCNTSKNEEPTNENIQDSMEESDLWVTYKASENPQGKHIVLVAGDEEYRSEEVLPQLAKILSRQHGFDCTVLFAQNPENPGIIDPNYSFNIPGLELLEKADLMILLTRWRILPEQQVQYFDNYLSAGKPLFAIRTATHAFNYQKQKDHPFAHYGYAYKGDKKDWELGFGKAILGETWYTHHGHHKHQSTRGIIAPGAENHPVLNSIEDGAIWGPTDVYGIRMPMAGDAQSLVLGQTIDREGEFDKNDLFYGMKESDSKVATEDRPGSEEVKYNPNDPMPPIVWTKSYQIKDGKKGLSLTSTIGASTDFADEDLRRLFVNASYYLLGLEVPKKASADFVGTFTPSAFGFHDDEYWATKQLKVSDYKE